MAVRAPVLRAILLGASNLRGALPAVLAAAQQRASGPFDALVACGHGRSYGTWSRFLYVRRLPGIATCGLWRALEKRSPLPTVALLTDIGNDLVYGAGVAEISGWVETCLDWLALMRAETVLTLLPMARLEKLSSWQVRLAVALLFPGRPAPWPGLLERCRELDARLRRLAADRGVRLVEPADDWYGIDPIHLRRSVRTAVWDQVLSQWNLGPIAPRPTRLARIRIPLLGAEEMALFGTILRRRQPAVRLPDGSTVALY